MSIEIEAPKAAEPAAEVKAIPAPVVVEAKPEPVAAVLNAEEIAEKAVAKERGRIAEVTALCKTAGFPEAAQNYIETGASPVTVQAELFKKLCEARPAKTEPAANLASGPEARLSAEYHQHEDLYQKQGLSQEDFLRVRKLESGESTLNFPGIK